MSIKKGMGFNIFWRYSLYICLLNIWIGRYTVISLYSIVLLDGGSIRIYSPINPLGTFQYNHVVSNKPGLDTWDEPVPRPYTKYK